MTRLLSNDLEHVYYVQLYTMKEKISLFIIMLCFLTRKPVLAIMFDQFGTDLSLGPEVLLVKRKFFRLTRPVLM